MKRNSNKRLERPDGIIITISQQMLKEKGYENWVRNFIRAMEKDDMIYWFRTGNKPQYEVLYIYLCISGKIRYRIQWVGNYGYGTMKFDNGKEIYGNAWIAGCGPLTKPDEPIYRKGFQGFRYTQKLF